MTSAPGFSSFPAIRMFAPAKVVETIEVNGWPVCAKPKGVTPKWLPIYHELASRMYEGGPSFSIGKNTVDSPITCMVADGNGGWAEYRTPEDAAKAIGLAPATKAKGAPKAYKDIRTNPAYIAAKERNKAEVRNVTDHFAKTPKVPARPSIPARPASDLPTWATEWLAGLVFETKRHYAEQFLRHLLLGEPAPQCPGTEWADKARRRAERLVNAA